jgi:Flp pilus assembly protein TadG
MKMLNLLRRCQRGAAAVEFALSVPILVLFIYGIFQVGLLFQANAGMQHALGEGARYATLCIPTSTGCNIHTDVEVRDLMSSKVFGMNIGTFSTPTVTTPATTSCTHCKDLTVSYTVTPNFLFFNGPPVTLTRTKRVYQAF